MLAARFLEDRCAVMRFSREARAGARLSSLDQVFARGLAKRETERWSSAAQLVDAIDAALTARTPARSGGWRPPKARPEASPRAPRRRRRMAAVAAAALAASLVGVGIGIGDELPTGQINRPANQPKIAARPARSTLPRVIRHHGASGVKHKAARTASPAPSQPTIYEGPARAAPQPASPAGSRRHPAHRAARRSTPPPPPRAPASGHRGSHQDQGRAPAAVASATGPDRARPA